MTDKPEVDSAPVSAEPTSDQILKDIEAAEQQLENQDKAKVQVNEPNVASGQDQVDKALSDKPSKLPVTSTDGVSSVPGGSDKTDTSEELMKKKGWKDVDDIIRSYKGLERELHRRGKVAQPKEEPRFVPPAQPVNQPTTPESRPINPTVTLQELAQHYGALPEDVQRVAMISRDVVNALLAQQLQPLAADVAGIKRDTDNERSFSRLGRDPLFRNRDVQIEMHKLAEEDPSILEKPDYPEQLFDKAMLRIGRRFVEQTIGNEGNSAEFRSGLPSSPPPSGKGSVSGPKGMPLKPPPASMTVEKFNNLSVAEMEKVLADRGAFSKK